MTRTLFSGGAVFDPASGTVAAGDVVVAEGRVVEVGTRLDGDVEVDVTGRTLLPGLMDCHVHMSMTDFDMIRLRTRRSRWGSSRRSGVCARSSTSASPPCATPAARTRG